MALAIVWRNPQPVTRTKHTVQRVRGGQSGAVYVITDLERTQEFRLVLRRADIATPEVAPVGRRLICLGAPRNG